MTCRRSIEGVAAATSEIPVGEVFRWTTWKVVGGAAVACCLTMGSEGGNLNLGGLVVC